MRARRLASSADLRHFWQSVGLLAAEGMRAGDGSDPGGPVGDGWASCFGEFQATSSLACIVDPPECMLSSNGRRQSISIATRLSAAAAVQHSFSAESLRLHLRS